MAAAFGENEVITERVVGASRERVFRAWTDPAQLALWWGPKGFRNTFREFDPRAGGEWRFVMHGPDGTDYPNHSVFVEVAPEKIVLDHLSGHRFRVTATFEETEGGTKVVFRQKFENEKDFDQAKPYCVEGNEQNFDRLDALLAGTEG